MTGPGPRRRHRRRARTPGHGFTLIELTAVLVILAVLGSISSFLLAGAIDGYVSAATAAQVHSDLSVAMDRLVREFRRIPPHPTVPGAVPYIASAGPTALSWYDADADAYSVALAGTVLTLAADGGAPADLLADVTSFSLGYRDEDDAVLATPMTGSPAVDPIRRLTIDIAVTRKGISESLSAKVFIRSCMSGS